MTVVADSTPLIHLSVVSDLSFLHSLFRSILIPPAVFQEVVGDGGRMGPDAVGGCRRQD